MHVMVRCMPAGDDPPIRDSQMCLPTSEFASYLRTISNVVLHSARSAEVPRCRRGADDHSRCVIRKPKRVADAGNRRRRRTRGAVLKTHQSGRITRAARSASLRKRTLGIEIRPSRP